MSNIKYIISALIIAVALLMLSPPSPFYFRLSKFVNQGYDEAEINPEQLTRLLAKKDALLLIDVRTIYEYELEHIPNAISIPLDEIEQSMDKIKRLVKNRRVVTYCSTNPRSYRALSILADHDIHGSNLSGGFDNWWDFKQGK